MSLIVLTYKYVVSLGIKPTSLTEKLVIAVALYQLQHEHALHAHLLAWLWEAAAPLHMQLSSRTPALRHCMLYNGDCKYSINITDNYSLIIISRL